MTGCCSRNCNDQSGSSQHGFVSTGSSNAGKLITIRELFFNLNLILEQQKCFLSDIVKS